ncbi:hypothetical protein Q9323_15075 [Pseudomonas fulva]|uniref:hypothetical protein n=1 Tax=Pseudomonas fulva TaxID=47880 RepID=UPI0031F6BADE
MRGFQERLTTLYKAEGEHIAYEITGRMDITHFTRTVRDLFNKRAIRGKAEMPKYSYLWFTTENGLMFYATGPQYFTETFEGIVERYAKRMQLGAERVFKGANKDLFMVRVGRDLEKFKSRKGVNSFGGK